MDAKTFQYRHSSKLHTNPMNFNNSPCKLVMIKTQKVSYMFVLIYYYTCTVLIADGFMQTRLAPVARWSSD